MSENFPISHFFLEIDAIFFLSHRYKNFKQRMRQYSAPASPVRYDPVIIANQQNGSETQTNLKEYETQVLAMAVPNDEHEDLQIDFSAKNHAFSLDNVSYITHKENGELL